MRHDHPGSSVEEVAAGGDRTGAFPARHRVGPGIPRHVNAPVPDVLEDRHLHRGDIRDHSAWPAVELRGHHCTGHVGGRRDDHEVGG